MTFPKDAGWGGEMGLGTGRGDGLGFVVLDVGATEEFVDDGRDHPGPVTVDG